jgi:hypothetical protein
LIPDVLHRADDLLPWAVLWPVLAGIGAFIDKYYLSKRLKSRVQDKLIQWFVAIDDAWKRFYGGSRAARQLGLTGRVIQAILGMAWFGVVAWWADAKARGSAPRSLDWSYVGPLIARVFEGLLGGAIASLVLVLVMALLFVSLVAAAYAVTRLVMSLLSVGSDPVHSPFGFAGSLIGLAVVSAKLIFTILWPDSNNVGH